jgi:hypothetical protein
MYRRDEGRTVLAFLGRQALTGEILNVDGGAHTNRW